MSTRHERIDLAIESQPNLIFSSNMTAVPVHPELIETKIKRKFDVNFKINAEITKSNHDEISSNFMEYTPVFLQEYENINSLCKDIRKKYKDNCLETYSIGDYLRENTKEDQTVGFYFVLFYLISLLPDEFPFRDWLSQQLSISKVRTMYEIVNMATWTGIKGIVLAIFPLLIVTSLNADAEQVFLYSTCKAPVNSRLLSMFKF